MKDILQEALDKFNQSINKKNIILDMGLCGVFALNMYNHLKILGYSPRILGIYYTTDEIKVDNKYNIPTHYVVQVNKTIIDFDDIYTTLKEYRTSRKYRLHRYTILKVPLKELKRQIDTGRGATNSWNPDMFTKQNIKTVDIVFKKVFTNDVTVNNIRLHTSVNSMI